jgi:MFS family permease
MNQSPSDNAAQEKPSAKTAYGYLAFFVILNYLNMVDRNLLAAFAPSIVEDLQLSDTQYGLLTGLIFVTVYAITGLFMGAMADRYHRPRIIGMGLAIWSSLTAATGATYNFAQIAFTRVFIGVGESALSPTAMSMLSDLFPPQKRGMATGVYYFGVPIGAGSSYLLAGQLGPIIGWRNCFYLLGGIGLVFVAVCFLLKDPKRGVMDEGNKSANIEIKKFSFITAWHDVMFCLRTSKALVFTIIAAVAMSFPVGAGAMEMLWLVRERGFDEADIATKFGVIFMISGTLAAIFGAVVSDWYHARYKSGRLGFMLICLLTMVPILSSYRFIPPDSPFFFICMAITFFYVSFSYGPVLASIQDLTPVPYRATILGFHILVINIIGAGVSAGGVGLLSDFLQQQGNPNALTISLFCAGLVTLIAVPCLIIAIKNYHADIEKLHNLKL